MADIIPGETTREDDNSWSPFAGMPSYDEGMKTTVEPDDAPIPPQVQKGEEGSAAPTQEGAKQEEVVKEAPKKEGAEDDLFTEAKTDEDTAPAEEGQPQRGRKPMSSEEYEAKQMSNLYDVFVEEWGWGEIPEEQKPRNPREFCEFVTAAIEQNSVPKYANEELQALDQYVRQGGSIADYLRRVADVSYDDLTINSEQNQKYAVAELLKLQGYPPEHIQRKVETYAQKGVLEAEAQDALQILKGYSQTTRQQELQQQQQQLQYVQQATDNFIRETSATLSGMKEMFGIPLSYRDKAELFSYVFDRDESGQSQYMKDYSASPAAILQSAFLTRWGRGAMTRAQQTGEKKAMDRFRETLSQQQMRSRGQARGSRVASGGGNKVKQITDAFKI